VLILAKLENTSAVLVLRMLQDTSAVLVFTKARKSRRRMIKEAGASSVS